MAANPGDRNPRGGHLLRLPVPEGDAGAGRGHRVRGRAAGVDVGRQQRCLTFCYVLVQKANELGGTELVNKWIDLHVLGKKKDELTQIATELGYQ